MLLVSVKGDKRQVSRAKKTPTGKNKPRDKMKDVQDALRVLLGENTPGSSCFILRDRTRDRRNRFKAT